MLFKSSSDLCVSSLFYNCIHTIFETVLSSAKAFVPYPFLVTVPLSLSSHYYGFEEIMIDDIHLLNSSVVHKSIQYIAMFTLHFYRDGILPVLSQVDLMEDTPIYPLISVDDGFNTSSTHLAQDIKNM